MPSDLDRYSDAMAAGWNPVMSGGSVSGWLNPQGGMGIPPLNQDFTNTTDGSSLGGEDSTRQGHYDLNGIWVGPGGPSYANQGGTMMSEPIGVELGSGDSRFGVGSQDGGRDVNGDGSIDDLDRQIADIEGQIATAMSSGGGSPDYSAFYQSPGYDFRLQEGINALDKSASAKGKLGSGGLQRELTRYGQGLATQEFNSYANRLASMAGLGQSATTATGQLGANAAGQYGATSGQLGQTILAGGQAQASGYIGSNNALMQGYTGAIDAFSGGGEGGGSSNTLPGFQSQPYNPGVNWY